MIKLFPECIGFVFINYNFYELVKKLVHRPFHVRESILLIDPEHR